MFYGNHFLFLKGKMTPVMICQNNPRSFAGESARARTHRRRRGAPASTARRAERGKKSDLRDQWVRFELRRGGAPNRVISYSTLRRFLLHRVESDTSIGDNRLFLSKTGSLLK
jgi:hypothetical protein